jgi:hypothetical protein
MHLDQMLAVGRAEVDSAIGGVVGFALTRCELGAAACYGCKSAVAQGYEFAACIFGNVARNVGTNKMFTVEDTVQHFFSRYGLLDSHVAKFARAHEL